MRPTRTAYGHCGTANGGLRRRGLAMLGAGVLLSVVAGDAAWGQRREIPPQQMQARVDARLVAAPSETAEGIGAFVRAGNPVTAKAISGEFHEVEETNGHVGWMRSRHIEPVGSCSSRAEDHFAFLARHFGHIAYDERLDDVGLSMVTRTVSAPRIRSHTMQSLLAGLARYDPGTVALLYYYGAHATCVLLVDRTGIVAYQSQKVSAARVEEAVWDFMRSIVPAECLLARSPRRHTEPSPTRRAGSCDPAKLTQRSPAEDLKAKELEAAIAGVVFPEAIERAVARYKHVVIVPYGSLSILPFGALTLPRAKSQFVDLAAYTVAPAFTQIGIGRGLHVPRPVSRKKPNAIVVGNPQFVDLGPPARRDREWEFEDLPGSEEEARTVGTLLGVEPLLRDEATLADVRMRLTDLQARQQSLDILYLATHGVTTSDSIEARLEDATSRSFLALRGGERLSSDTLASTGYRGSRLVVLSACVTGRGWIAEGGSVGLPHLFHLNKAEEIVMSLWSVSDDATGYLMQSMMAEYARHWPRMSAAVALRSAMLKARQRFKHPALWAAFSAFGVAPFVN